MSNNPKLTISLVTWNGAKYIRDCLDNVLAQTFQDFELLVIDNGSKDETLSIIKNEYSGKFGEKMKISANTENLGFAKGHNHGISMCQVKYVFLLNQDIILDPRYLEWCVKFLDNHPAAGIVSGKIYKWDFKAWQSAEETPSSTVALKNKAKTHIIDSLGLRIFKSQKVVEQSVGEVDHGQFTDDLEVFGVSFAVPVIRRSALEEVKFENEYLDEDFFSYKEDVDMSYRLRWAGWESWVLARALAWHDRGAKSMEDLSFMDKIKFRRSKSFFVNYNSYKNQFFVMVKNLPTRLYWKYFLYIEGNELKKFVYILFFEPSTLSALKEFSNKNSRMKLKRKFILDNRKITEKEMQKWYF